MDVIEIRDGSLAGMAEFLRREYGVADNLAVLCRNRETGEYDVSWSLTEDRKEELKRVEGEQRRAMSERAKAERLRNKENYLRRRDRAKKAKMPLVVQ